MRELVTQGEDYPVIRCHSVVPVSTGLLRRMAPKSIVPQPSGNHFGYLMDLQAKRWVDELFSRFGV